MYILAHMWFVELIRQFFFSIDKVIFGAVGLIYNFLVDISRVSVLSQTQIKDFATRIYALLAIFMVFKVTLSLITYLVNPDDFTDGSKGVSKLATNIIISLCFLILTPYAFNLLYRVQAIILEDNSIATLIFGDSAGDENNNVFNTAGELIAYSTFSPFFTPNTTIDELSECIFLLENEDGVYNFNKDCSGYIFENGVFTATDEPTGFAKLVENNSISENDVKNYIAGVTNNSFGLTFRQELVVARTTVSNNGVNREEFIMDYKFIFSTAVGVFVCLILIGFCMDVAVRSIKLAFYQLIAPIPIISYVDPKSGKDGMFKKWYQAVLKTYVSLFVRLLALYFAVYIISMVVHGQIVDSVDGSKISSPLLVVFVVIGALMFAKELPKILEGIGIKLDGNGFSINPIKKLEENAIGGKSGIIKKGTGLATGIGVGAAATVGGLLTGRGIHADTFKNALKNGWNGEKLSKNYKSSYEAATNKHNQLQAMRRDGVKIPAVALRNFKTAMGFEPNLNVVEGLKGDLNSVTSGYKTFYDTVLGQDKIAKEFERRRVAAHERGDADMEKLWQDSIDARVKEIDENGFEVVLDDRNNISMDMANLIEQTRRVYTDNNVTITNSMYRNKFSNADKIESSAALDATRKNINDAVEDLNSHYKGKYGFDELDESLGLKALNGKAKGATTTVEQNSLSEKTIAKYTKNGSKK